MSEPVKPWKLISSEPVLTEKWFPVRKDTVELPSGRVVNDYFVWEAPHIVKVVPITADKKFVVCKQYRHAVGRVTMQFPAGAVDKEETPEAGALRELKEETGYVCTGELVHVGTVAPYATKMTGLTDIYLALGVTKEAEPHYDDQEETEVCLMTADEIWDILDRDDSVQQMDLPASMAYAERYLRKNQ